MASNSSPQQMVVESKNLRQKLVIFIPRIQQVIQQTSRRILELEIKQVILPKGGYRNQERVNHERKRTF